ncbi:MAG: flavodoxin family protein [Methanomassiliicoccaceae archaeon]|nr:flavodoxin family protein [Methanomassiliicoccaceae archaeon]
MNINIIGVVASPRREGNTAWAVNRILEGAKECGAEIHCFCFSDLDIGPCRGCLRCKKGDKGCVVDDDMQTIYGSIAHADAIILGSPVYMGQMSAQAKLFTDRLFACSSPRFSPYFKENGVKKKMVLVFTQGNPDSDKFRTYFNYTRDMFRLLEFDVTGVHVIAGLRNGPANGRIELHSAMKDIGSSLVSEQ